VPTHVGSEKLANAIVAANTRIVNRRSIAADCTVTVTSWSAVFEPSYPRPPRQQGSISEPRHLQWAFSRRSCAAFLCLYFNLQALLFVKWTSSISPLVEAAGLVPKGNAVAGLASKVIADRITIERTIYGSPHVTGDALRRWPSSSGRKLLHINAISWLHGTAEAPSIIRCDDRCWHVCDMPAGGENACSLGWTGSREAKRLTRNGHCWVPAIGFCSEVAQPKGNTGPTFDRAPRCSTIAGNQLEQIGRLPFPLVQAWLSASSAIEWAASHLHVRAADLQSRGCLIGESLDRKSISNSPS